MSGRDRDAGALLIHLGLGSGSRSGEDRFRASSRPWDLTWAVSCWMPESAGGGRRVDRHRLVRGRHAARAFDEVAQQPASERRAHGTGNE